MMDWDDMGRCRGSRPGKARKGVVFPDHGHSPSPSSSVVRRPLSLNLLPSPSAPTSASMAPWCLFKETGNHRLFLLRTDRDLVTDVAIARCAAKWLLAAIDDEGSSNSPMLRFSSWRRGLVD